MLSGIFAVNDFHWAVLSRITSGFSLLEIGKSRERIAVKRVRLPRRLVPDPVRLAADLGRRQHADAAEFILCDEVIVDDFAVLADRKCHGAGSVC